MTAPDAAIVDVVFDVEATSLPADYAWPLALAIERVLPWLASEAQAGIHPLRANPTSYGTVLLAQRAKLVLRVPQARLADMRSLEHAVLDVAGQAMRLGAHRARELRPSVTLHAQRVAADTDDEAAFERTMQARLAALGIDCRFISGRRRSARAGEREIRGFALALHALRPNDSLRIQATGLGGDRRLGWGIFVPAKEIAAAA